HRPVAVHPALQAGGRGRMIVAGVAEERGRVQHVPEHVLGRRCRVRPIRRGAHGGIVADMTQTDTASTDSTTAPVARLAMITLDATEPEPLARFWSAVLGWPIAVATAEYAMLTGPSHALGIGAVPDHRPPSWPDEGRKQF